MRSRESFDPYIESNQSMKPTPKAFASRLAPLRGNFRVFATAPSTASRFPAYAPASASILFPGFGLPQGGVISLVRFASSRSRTPAVLFSTMCRGLSLSR